jgi:hypothetical protein
MTYQRRNETWEKIKLRLDQIERYKKTITILESEIQELAKEDKSK